MYPIQVGNYDFKKVYLWLQYSVNSPAFTEIAIEIFYPNSMQADGLVMFDHGFVIGTDPLFYPKLILSKITGQETPLFQLNPSRYYNYSSAAIEHNWALAFVTSCHEQADAMPWTNFGGNPRVGQAAYAAASYLIKYGATHKYQDEQAVRDARFLKQRVAKGAGMMNRVLFAGHSVGGAHAQVAATGFESLQRIGRENGTPFDPVFFNREVIPEHTPPLSKWDPFMLASPAGLLQLSPVDGAGGHIIPFLAPGMEAYRKELAGKQLPNLMVTGSCDSACLDASNSRPPAWIDEEDRSSQYAQMAEGNPFAAICMVVRGSHCGYLRHRNDICSLADTKRCAEGEPYQAGTEEYQFTTALLNRYIGFLESLESEACTIEEWKNGGLMQWLNNLKPDIPPSGAGIKPVIDLNEFSDGFVHFSPPRKKESL